MDFMYKIKFKLIKLYFKNFLFSDVQHLKLQDFLTSPDQYLIIDCRDTEEFNISNIPYSYNLPGTEITKEILLKEQNSELSNPILSENCDKPVLFYCSIGYRSSLGAGR